MMNMVQLARRFVRDDWGGTETVVLETSKRLLKMGHETEIVCSKALSSSDEDCIDGVRVKRVPYFYPYWGLKNDARRRLDKKGGNLFSFSLFKTLNEHPGLDLIHLHTTKRFGGIARHVARRRGIPYVVSLHGGVHDVPEKEVRTWTEPTKGTLEWGKVLGWWVGSRRVLEDAAAIICVGEQERNEIRRRIPGKRVIHLPNGVDSKKFDGGDGPVFRRRHGIPRDATIILSVGRFDPQKNQLFGIQTFSKIARKNSNLHLLLIGHITNEWYFAEIESEVKKLGLENQVTILPGLPPGGRELIDAYNASDIFLLTSIHEPFGIVILEAWAAGLPVVASRVGGVPSFVCDGQDGFLFESDDEQSCLAKLDLLISRAPLRRVLAEAGKKKARETYDWKIITRRLERIYQEVLRENSLR